MKRSAPIAARRALAWVLCVLMLAGTILTALPVSAAEADIAGGKTAIACHSESAALTPAMALDGKSSTRFAAGGGCAHDTWYILDLGDNFDLSRVRINWEAAHPSAYVLEISKDGQTYTELKTVTDAPAGWVETPVSGTGRFLRIREVTRALAPYGFSMWDLEVYGTAAAERNDGAYYSVSVGEAKYGTLKLSHEGLVPQGTQVTLTVTPMSGGSLIKLTQNGKDVTSQVKDGKYVFTPTRIRPSRLSSLPRPQAATSARMPWCWVPTEYPPIISRNWPIPTRRAARSPAVREGSTSSLRTWWSPTVSISPTPPPTPTT